MDNVENLFIPRTKEECQAYIEAEKIAILAQYPGRKFGPADLCRLARFHVYVRLCGFGHEDAARYALWNF